MGTSPRIEAVRAAGPTTLEVSWRDGGTDRIDLSEWLAVGEPVLADLARPEVFAHPAIGDYGWLVFWGDPDGDLAIDARHLAMIAARQKSTGSNSPATSRRQVAG